MDCGCGRSPTGKCIGWHKLSEEEYLEAKKNYQEKEKAEGFSEAVSSITTNEKITFFNLGPKNDWKKILTDDLKNRINHTFEKNLKEL